MPKIGLALSGGGFRATLFHLGLIRFLRDANTLGDVTHITSVSGGSILAAHLVLNWDRYNGTPQEFGEAAKEILDFVKLDVRNRIVRRFPFVVIRHVLRWVSRRPIDRKLSRTGLLEHYYQKHLYGDTCLYELPERPELHMLSTNLSEGCICSFTRSGLIMQRRLPGDRVQFERIQAGLATVPLAVAASSAFPGFFPPIKLRSTDIGASESAFSQQTFTDGGVFDNLGIRAFRFIERCWSEACRPTEADGREMEVEKVGAGVASDAREEGHSAGRVNGSATGRGGGSRRADSEGPRDWTAGDDDSSEDDDPEHGPRHEPETVPGSPPPVRPTASGFDVVIASDAGAKLTIHRDAFTGGLIQTALRASDILMDRVWQLEKEIFGAAPGFLFAPIYSLIGPEEDPHAPLPVVQRQVVGMRTDMDRFTPEEVRSLVRQGYCVARQACRKRPDIFGGDLPDGPAWDPIPQPPRKLPRLRTRRDRPPREETVLARELQQSAARRIWSTLLDWRDGMTYLFLPFMIALLLVAPALTYWTYASSRSTRHALELVLRGNPDEARLVELMQGGPVRSLEGLPPRQVERLEPPDYRGFEFLSDSHIVDLRLWDQTPSIWTRLRRPQIYQYRRLQVRRVAAQGASEHVRLQFASRSADLDLRCASGRLRPVLKQARAAAPGGASGGPSFRWELDLDFSRVPVGETVDVVIDQVYRGEELQGARAGNNSLVHVSNGVTRVATMWILMPDRRPSGQLQLVAHKTHEPGERRPVRPTRLFEAQDGTVVGWQIIGPDPDTTYEGHWVLD